MSNQKLSTEERLLALEENVSYIKELLEVNNDSYNKLIKALSSLKDNDKNNQEEMTEWAETVEERIGRLMVEHVNVSLIIGETVNLTPEQEKRIQQKVQEIKQKHAEEGNNQSEEEKPKQKKN